MTRLLGPVLRSRCAPVPLSKRAGPTLLRPCYGRPAYIRIPARKLIILRGRHASGTRWPGLTPSRTTSTSGSTTTSPAPRLRLRPGLRPAASGRLRRPSSSRTTPTPCSFSSSSRSTATAVPAPPTGSPTRFPTSPNAFKTSCLRIHDQQPCGV